MIEILMWAVAVFALPFFIAVIFFEDAEKAANFVMAWMIMGLVVTFLSLINHATQQQSSPEYKLDNTQDVGFTINSYKITDDGVDIYTDLSSYSLEVSPDEAHKVFLGAKCTAKKYSYDVWELKCR